MSSEKKQMVGRCVAFAHFARRNGAFYIVFSIPLKVDQGNYRKVVPDEAVRTEGPQGPSGPGMIECRYLMQEYYFFPPLFTLIPSQFDTFYRSYVIHLYTTL